MNKRIHRQSWDSSRSKFCGGRERRGVPGEASVMGNYPVSRSRKTKRQDLKLFKPSYLYGRGGTTFVLLENLVRRGRFGPRFPQPHPVTSVTAQIHRAEYLGQIRVAQMVLRRNHRRQNGECLAADVIGNRRKKQCPDNPPAYAAGFWALHRISNFCKLGSTPVLLVLIMQRRELFDVLDLCRFCNGGNRIDIKVLVEVQAKEIRRGSIRHRGIQHITQALHGV